MSQHQISGSSLKVAAQARFEKLLVQQQTSVDRRVPIDYRALGAARLQVLEASTCHSDHAPNARARRTTRKEQMIQRAAKESWYRIAPVMLEVKHLLQTNGVDNLYWLGTKPNGEGVCFSFLFPPGVSDALVEQLAGPLRHLIQQQSPVDDALSDGWQSMNPVKQVLSALYAMPLFKRTHLMTYID